MSFDEKFDWEGRYRAKTAAWDKGAVVPGIADWLPQVRALEGRVVVPGCGYGHEAAAVARAWPEAEVVGIDVAETAIAGACERYDFPNLKFEVGDFFAEAGEGDLAAVIEHTCFCAIPPQMRSVYRDCCARRIRRGGLVVAVFYLNPIETETDPDGGPPWGTSVPELDAFFANDFATIVSKVPERAFPGREMRELLRILEKK